MQARSVFIALCGVCAALSVYQVIAQTRRRQPCGEDGRNRYHRRMQPLREALRGVAVAGYHGDEVTGYPGLPADRETGMFWAQHHALPAILRRDAGDALVVVNLHGDDAAARARALGWRLEADLGGGLFLMRKVP